MIDNVDDGGDSSALPGNQPALIEALEKVIEHTVDGISEAQEGVFHIPRCRRLGAPPRDEGFHVHFEAPFCGKSARHGTASRLIWVLLPLSQCLLGRRR
jgi:hypothetical protein